MLDTSKGTLYINGEPVGKGKIEVGTLNSYTGENQAYYIKPLFDKEASFKLDLILNLPYFRNLFWAQYVSDSKSYVVRYMYVYNRALADWEKVWFALAKLLEGKLYGSYMPRPILSTEYKMYRNAVAWFCGDKNKQPSEPEKYFHINEKKENRHDRRMHKMRRAV